MIERIVQGEMTETVRSLVRWLLASGELLLVGIVLLLVAIAAAKLVEVVIRILLRRMRLDALAARLGVDLVLTRLGPQVTLSYLLSRVAFFVAVLLVADIAADAVGLDAVASLLASILRYVPRVLAAGLILLVGLAAAGAARQAVMRAAGDSGIEYASALGGLVFAVLVFAIGVMVISQLQITTDAIWLVIGWLLAALALALGLSFGLGARDLTRNILAGFYARRIFRIGQAVEFDGHRGVLLSITPTHTLIDQSDAVISIANSRLLDEVVRQPK